MPRRFTSKAPTFDPNLGQPKPTLSRDPAPKRQGQSMEEILEILRLQGLLGPSDKSMPPELYGTIDPPQFVADPETIGQPELFGTDLPPVNEPRPPRQFITPPPPPTMPPPPSAVTPQVAPDTRTPEEIHAAADRASELRRAKLEAERLANPPVPEAVPLSIEEKMNWGKGPSTPMIPPEMTPEMLAILNSSIEWDGPEDIPHSDSGPGWSINGPAEGITPEILEVLNQRKDATEATANATDQYEADVADYKNTLATEAEQGIASLPEFKKDVFNPRGQGRSTVSIGEGAPRAPGKGNFDPNIMTPIPGSGNISIKNNSFIDVNDPYFGEPQPFAYIPESDIVTAGTPPMSTVPAENPYANVFEAPLTLPETPSFPETPPFFPELGEGYVDINDPYFGEPQPWVYTPDSDVITAATPPISTTSVDPSGTSPINLPWDPTNPPWDPPLPPVDPPPLPPVDPGPTGPMNPYTGKVIKNPYQPYSTESGATPLVKAITPKGFGIAPGFDRTGSPLPPPLPPHIDPPRRPIYIDDEPPPKGAKHGKYLSDSFLNKGISQLPTGGQNDTLTTQVFQAGFRPRR